MSQGINYTTLKTSGAEHKHVPQRAHHFEVGAADVKELFRQAVYEVSSLPSRVSCLKQGCEHIRGCHLLPARLLHCRLRPGSRAASGLKLAVQHGHSSTTNF